MSTSYSEQQEQEHLGTNKSSGLCSGRCGKLSHPSYGNRCEDCWVDANVKYNSGQTMFDADGMAVHHIRVNRGRGKGGFKE